MVHLGLFFSSLILVDPEFLVLKYQTILSVRTKDLKKQNQKAKSHPENQVMFPLSKGLTLCMTLESQLNDCRLAAFPSPDL